MKYLGIVALRTGRGFSSQITQNSLPFTTALEAAVENGLLTGNNGQIMPNNDLTRAEMATIMTRAFGAQVEADISAYTDVSATAWYADEIAKAVEMGLLQGYGSTMNPDATITRQEVFVVLARAFSMTASNESVLDGYGDVSEVASWATAETAALVEAGMVAGDTAGNLNPTDNILRKDFAVIMNRLIQTYITEEGTVTEVAEGSVLIRVADVTLDGVDISGNLILADGIGTGDATLNDVTVSGTTLIRGGGENSIHATGDTNLGNVIINNVSGAVSLKMADNATATSIEVLSDGVSLTGVPEGTTVVVGSDVADATLNGETVSAGESVTAETTTTTTTSSGSSSGGSSSSSSSSSGDSSGDADDSSTDTGTTTENGWDGDDYTIAVAGTTLTDMTIDTLTIAASVGTGDYTLKNCSVTTLITNGGGANSGHLVGGYYGAVKMENAPDEGSRLVFSENVIVGSVTAAATAILEVDTGSTATIGAVTASEDLTVKNTTLSEVTTTGSTSTLTLAEGAGITSLTAESDTTIVADNTETKIETISTASTITTDANTAVGTIDVTDASAEIATAGSVDAITGTAGTVSVADAGDVNISASATTVTVAGNSTAVVSGAVETVTAVANDDDDKDTAVNVTGEVSNVTTTGTGTVSSLTIDSTSDTIVTVSATVATLTASSAAATTVTGTATVDTVVATAGTVKVDDTVTTTEVLATTEATVKDSSGETVTTTTVTTTLSYIDVTTMPSTTTYYTTDSFSTQGMVVTAYYSVTDYSGTISKTVAVEDCEVSTLTMSEGTQTVTVTYSGKTASFTITVVDADAQAAAAFISTYASVWDKTVNTVTISDKAVVALALDAYVALDANVKTLLTTQYSLLTSLSAEITRLEAVAAALATAKEEAITELNAYWGVTETQASYDADGVAKIAEIRVEYAQYITDATDDTSFDGYLANAKSSIDAVATLAEKNQAAADDFAQTYKDVLAWNAADLSLADEEKLAVVITAYNALDTAVQALLTDEKAKLSDLQDALDALKAEQDDDDYLFETLEWVLDSTGRLCLNVGKQLPDFTDHDFEVELEIPNSTSSYSLDGDNFIQQDNGDYWITTEVMETAMRLGGLDENATATAVINVEITGEDVAVSPVAPELTITYNTTQLPAIEEVELAGPSEYGQWVITITLDDTAPTGAYDLFFATEEYDTNVATYQAINGNTVEFYTWDNEITAASDFLSYELSLANQMTINTDGTASLTICRQSYGDTTTTDPDDTTGGTGGTDVGTGTDNDYISNLTFDYTTGYITWKILAFDDGSIDNVRYKVQLLDTTGATVASQIYTPTTEFNIDINQLITTGTVKTISVSYSLDENATYSDPVTLACDVTLSEIVMANTLTMEETSSGVFAFTIPTGVSDYDSYHVYMTLGGSTTGSGGSMPSSTTISVSFTNATADSAWRIEFYKTTVTETSRTSSTVTYQGVVSDTDGGDDTTTGGDDDGGSTTAPDDVVTDVHFSDDGYLYFTYDNSDGRTLQVTLVNESDTEYTSDNHYTNCVDLGSFGAPAGTYKQIIFTPKDSSAILYPEETVTWDCDLTLTCPEETSLGNITITLIETAISGTYDYTISGMATGQYYQFYLGDTWLAGGSTNTATGTITNTDIVNGAAFTLKVISWNYTSDTVMSVTTTSYPWTGEVSSASGGTTTDDDDTTTDDNDAEVLYTLGLDSKGIPYVSLNLDSDTLSDVTSYSVIFYDGDTKAVSFSTTQTTSNVMSFSTAQSQSYAIDKMTVTLYRNGVADEPVDWDIDIALNVSSEVPTAVYTGGYDTSTSKTTFSFTGLEANAVYALYAFNSVSNYYRTTVTTNSGGGASTWILADYSAATITINKISDVDITSATSFEMTFSTRQVFNLASDDTTDTNVVSNVTIEQGDDNHWYLAWDVENPTEDLYQCKIGVYSGATIWDTVDADTRALSLLDMIDWGSSATSFTVTVYAQDSNGATLSKAELDKTFSITWAETSENIYMTLLANGTTQVTDLLANTTYAFYQTGYQLVTSENTVLATSDDAGTAVVEGLVFNMTSRYQNRIRVIEYEETNTAYHMTTTMTQYPVGMGYEEATYGASGIVSPENATLQSVTYTLSNGATTSTYFWDDPTPTTLTVPAAAVSATFITSGASDNGSAASTTGNSDGANYRCTVGLSPATDNTITIATTDWQQYWSVSAYSNNTWYSQEVTTVDELTTFLNEISSEAVSGYTFKGWYTYDTMNVLDTTTLDTATGYIQLQARWDDSMNADMATAVFSFVQYPYVTADEVATADDITNLFLKDNAIIPTSVTVTVTALTGEYPYATDSDTGVTYSLTMDDDGDISYNLDSAPDYERYAIELKLTCGTETYVCSVNLGITNYSTDDSDATDTTD